MNTPASHLHNILKAAFAMTGRGSSLRRRHARSISSVVSTEALETRQLPAATLIRDFNPGTIPAGPYISPDSYFRGAAAAVFNDSLYYFENTSLWKTTDTKVEEVFNFDPGEEYVNATWLTVVGDHLYFSAPALNGTTLWVSDGTTQGTSPLRDAQQDCRFPEFLTDINGTLYFVATNDQIGYELWTSDGTDSGTQPVIDLVPGPGFGYIEQLTAFGDSAVFAATTPDSGRELWRTDGTAAGTQLLADLLPGTASSAPGSLRTAGNLLYFTAATADDRQLWVSDGTAVGTVLVTDASGAPVSNPGGLCTLGSRLLFSASDGLGTELWNATGTTASQVADIQPGSGSSDPQELVRMGDKIWFRADDGTSGQELWSSDGTAAGTHMLLDLNPQDSASPTQMAAADGQLFFAASDGQSGTEVWRTDGTVSGTILLQDIQPGPASGFYPSIGLKAGSHKAFFMADDGTNSAQIWSTDGTTAGTQMVSQPRTMPLSGEVREMTNLNGRLVFTVYNENGAGQIWTSDGSVAGTTLVRDLEDFGGSSLLNFTRLEDKVVFIGPAPNYNYALWATDGTAAGTAVIRDINPGGSIGQSSFTKFHNFLYFDANDGVNGSELWRTDGTADGTLLVADINPNPGESSWISNLIVAGDGLFFTASDGQHNNALWKSDGTTDGTKMVLDIHPEYGDSVRNLTAFNGRLYFAADDGQHGTELWTSDGTASGTFMVLDISPGPESSSPGKMQICNDRLIFGASDGIHGFELWSSDGTAGGTTLIRDIRPGAASSGDRTSPDIVKSGSSEQVYFVANDGVVGSEPWITDGTSAGTHLLKDILPGPWGSRPFLGRTAGDLMYLVANDGISGKELWQTDGTEMGTQLVTDLRPGLDASYTSEFLAVGSTLFLSGYSPVGYELFTAPVNHRPSDISLSSQSVSENQPEQTEVGLLSAADPDSAPVTSFRLVSGAGDADNALFSISGSSLRTAARFNFELRNSYSIRVQATDAEGQSSERSFTITITDANDQPTLDQPSDVFVFEDAGPLTINLTGISAGDGENQPLRVTATSSNSALIPNPLIGYTSANTTGQLTFSFAPRKAGSSSITVQVEDGGFDRDLSTAADNQTVTRTFQITVQPTRPVFTAPLGSIFDQQPLITFTDIPGATGYQLWLGNRSTGQLPLLQVNTVLPRFQVPSGLGIGRFDAYVRTQLPGSQFGPWSLLNRFSVITRAEIGPLAMRQTTARPTFSVTPLPGAVKYDFWLDNRSAGQTQYIRTVTDRPDWTPTTDLPLSRYRLWARGIAADGTPGGWSLQRDFLVVAAPQPLQPLSSTFSRNPTFAWTTVTGASTYEVSVRNAATGQFVTGASGLTDTSWTPAAPLPDGPYLWQVIATSTTAGFRSDWSPKINLNIGGRPLLQSPAGTQTTARPLLQWGAVSGALQYDVWINRVYPGGITSNIFRASEIPVNRLQLAAPLENSADYRFWVRAVSVSGDVSAWSLPLDFSVRLTQTLSPLGRRPRPAAAKPAEQDIPVTDEAVQQVVDRLYAAETEGGSAAFL